MIAVAVVSTALFAGLAVAGAAGQLPQLARARAPRGPGRLARLIVRAGVDATPPQVVAVSALAAVVIAIAVAATTPVVVLAAVPAALAGAAPTALLRRRARSRIAAIRQAWPDALAMISGTVRGGRPLSHALIDVSLSGPPALRDPLSGLAARIQTVGLVPALQAVRDAVAEPVTDRVVEVLVLAHTEGGRIAIEVVDDLAVAVADEVAAVEETETLALEGKLNARVVFALPWIVLVLLTAGAGPFQDFYTSPAGAAVIGIGAVLSLSGIAVATALSSVPEQPRVLVRGGEQP
ncbi:type II secretion system F family protein [Euzebya sp.]|uniref:type II secretion system F family protein n=1 Tax=Euzebya sp. TaxID=1971409 RepID=UPI003513D1DD